jgi:outer membrane protein OmpA-like peptidoglycan-associated protein
MITHRSRILGFAFALLLVAAPTVFGQSPTNQQPWDMPTATTPAPARNIPVGEKVEIKGTIATIDGQMFTVLDANGSLTTVVLTDKTSVKSEGNLFRPGATYDASALLRGLRVEVQGRGNASGQLEAKKVRFEKDDMKVARSIDTRVTPAEHRITSLEAQTRTLSGQVDELQEASKIMRNDIDTNAQNIAATDQRVTATNDRIAAVDDFEMAKEATVLFELNSAVLTPEAKTALDQLAKEALAMDGYVIEVAGFTDSTGSVPKNRTLSQHRAEAVVQYLGESCNVPLRRIITPFGYGEMNPAADNATLEGRMQNRRVHVMVLVSKGITGNVP